MKGSRGDRDWEAGGTAQEVQLVWQGRQQVHLWLVSIPHACSRNPCQLILPCLLRCKAVVSHVHCAPYPAPSPHALDRVMRSAIAAQNAARITGRSTKLFASSQESSSTTPLPSRTISYTFLHAGTYSGSSISALRTNKKRSRWVALLSTNPRATSTVTSASCAAP
jgi:hypothetical protein